MNNHKIQNYSLVLDKEFGKLGSPEREKAIKEAYSFFVEGTKVHSPNKE